METRESVVLFGDTPVGTSVQRVVTLVNHSRFPAPYQFLTKGDGTFSISEKYVQGVIPPLLSASVVINFAPTMVDNFYRRLFCLIKDCVRLVGCLVDLH